MPGPPSPGDVHPSAVTQPLTCVLTHVMKALTKQAEMLEAFLAPGTCLCG